MPFTCPFCKFVSHNPNDALNKYCVRCHAFTEDLQVTVIKEVPLEMLKRRIDMRMNDHLCQMKPDYDDSIVGFNEAWDIVRKAFAEAMQNV